tara:strand:+ start:1593 stop:1838 length:246 start_codon:yes stop_codon:yes gene_type:complete
VKKVLGEANFSRISVGDLISWTEISKERRKRKGIVLKKFVVTDLDLHKERKVAMLKVVDGSENKIVNILAINAKIESKSTT